MNDPKRASASKAERVGLPQDEDWWQGWRLDEPADSVLPRLDVGPGSEDWWAGWHAALLREADRG